MRSTPPWLRTRTRSPRPTWCRAPLAPRSHGGPATAQWNFVNVEIDGSADQDADRQHVHPGAPAVCDRTKGGADRCLGPSRGGLTTKIHVVVDAQRLPIRLGLPAGQTHDGQIANTPLDHLGSRTIVLADKAHDADRLRGLIHDQRATLKIPPKSNRKWKPCFSKRPYRERNLIERFSRS